MRSTKVLSISVPLSLWDEIGEVAEKEKMTRSELLRVAAREYIRSRSPAWHTRSIERHSKVMEVLLCAK